MGDRINRAVGLLLAAFVLAVVVFASGACVYEPCDCPCLGDGGADGGPDASDDGGD